VDKRPRLLPQVDEEIADTLVYHLRQKRVTFRLGEEVHGVLLTADERGPRVHIGLGSHKHIAVETALYSIGRTGATAGLNLEAAGLGADARGHIAVNEQYQTAAPHIYAVGDVIGFPGLAATSMEQGRLAACHMFEADAHSAPGLFPYGIYAIPEISMVGRTERELTDANIPYEVGKASYREIARGQILGDDTGMMKLLFHTDTRELLGVHIIGTGATELVHIGQAVMANGGGMDYFVNTVFNYPTLAECYKTAALDAANRLAA
jgi:NAD(P) transhydrogenase